MFLVVTASISAQDLQVTTVTDSGTSTVVPVDSTQVQVADTAAVVPAPVEVAETATETTSSVVAPVAPAAPVEIQVRGTVTDASTGDVVPFASIQIKGTSSGTATDARGQYSLTVPANATLIFSSIGYLTVDVPVNNRGVVMVNLDPSAEALDDVIVIAYGTANKKSFTGSASVLSGERISKRPVSNITNALAGATAGVQIVSTSGQPGASASIRIRGVGSINSSQEPLIVLDGVPYNGSLGSIVASDIETMTVLKDAAANSMYGSRGSNGVIMITTKRGQKGKTKVSIEIREGLNTRGVSGYEMVTDPGQYLQLGWEALRNWAQYNTTSGITISPALWASQNLTSETHGTGGYNPYNVAADQIVLENGLLNPAASLLYGDNWMEEPFRVGLRQEYIANISGGNDKTSFFMSLSYLDEEGYTINSDFDRFAARVKVDHQATSWFKTGMNIAYSRTNINNVSADKTGTNSSYVNMFMFAQGIAPIYPIYAYNPTTGAPILDVSGNKVYDYGDNTHGMGKRPYGALVNPLSAQINDNNLTNRDQTTATGYVEIKFLKDFKFTANVSANSSSYDKNDFQTPIGGDALNVGGRNTRSFGRNYTLNTQQLLNYNKTIKKHNIDVLLGHETNLDNWKSIYGKKENFLIPTNPELDNAARITGAGSSQSTITLQSLFARAQYSYDDKYFLTGSYRRDGSSVFHPDVRWGNFWSVGASWRIEQEEFMKSTSSWLNGLKLKASYGTQGNDRLYDGATRITNAYEDQYEVVPMDGNIGIAYDYRGVPDLTWEKSNNFNVGLEFEFVERIRGSVEYYNKTTTDLLYKKPLPGSMGSPSWIFTNAIDMRNSGVEVELGFDLVRNENMVWNLSANLTTLKNEILKLPADRDTDGEGYKYYDTWYKVGGSLYDYYMFASAGVDPDTGKALWWKDEDADGNAIEPEKTDIYGEASYRHVGKSGLPTIYGGISTSLEWRGIDFSVVCSYQIGGWGTDAQYQSYMNNMSSPGSGIHVDAMNNRWTAPGQVTDVPLLQWGLSSQNAASDRFLTSKSAFTVQNITLGYTLPDSVNKVLKIDRLRIYASGDNLFLFSARQGFDPRVSFGGGSRNNYSATRTISFGINLTF